MPGFNGAGVFERTYDWTDDKAAGVKVRADRMDAEMDAIATGLSNCITKDGQTTITADIPFNNNKITGLAAGSAAGDSVRFEQVTLLSAGGNQTITRTASGTVLTLESTDAGATSGPDFVLYRNSASPVASDIGGSILFDFEDSAGNQTTFGRVKPVMTDPTNGSEDGALYFGVITAGTLADELIMTGANFYPATDDGIALGLSGTAFADLFLASGAVINFNAGDVTITHGANSLAFAGASSGYTFDAAITPASNDGAALGASGTAWADLFLASGSVINFNAGDVTITHSANALAFAGASSGYSFDAAVTSSTSAAGTAAFVAVSTEAGASSGPCFTAFRDSASPAVSDILGEFRLDGRSSTGVQRTYSSVSAIITDPVNATEDALLLFNVIVAGTLTAKAYLGGLYFAPVANDGMALGATTLGWSDIFLASGGVINWNNGDVTITHSADLLTIAGGNLSIGTSGVFTAGTLEIGAASDTTLGRLEAGVLGVEGVPFSSKASSFFVAKTATQGISATTATTVTWTEAATGAHDTGSDFASHTWTAPYTGVVDVSAGITMTGTAGEEFFAFIRRNTTALAGAGAVLATSAGYGTGAGFASLRQVITVTAGDTLDVRVYCSAGMTVQNADPAGQSALASFFSATYV